MDDSEFLSMLLMYLKNTYNVSQIDGKLVIQYLDNIILR